MRVPLKGHLLFLTNGKKEGECLPDDCQTSSEQ